MRLENILDIVGGELLNSPAVSFFSGVATQISNIKHKYLYIAKDPQEIGEAINQGAYGIISETVEDCSNQESAIILVESVEEAIIRLFRFMLLESQAKRYMLPLEEAVIVKTLTSKDSLIVLEDFNLLEIDRFFQSPKDTVFAPSVFLNRLGIECSEVSHSNLAEVYTNGLFGCEVYLDKVYKLNFCSFFASELSKAISFLLANSYDINRSKFFEIPILEPIFLNRKIEQVEFGKSSRVALTESRIKTFSKALELFEKNVKWGKNLYLAPLQSGIEDHRVIRYSDNSDLVSILKSNEFNYALILSSKDSVVDVFSSESGTSLLF